jgi:hypothetical protein
VRPLRALQTPGDKMSDALNSPDLPEESVTYAFPVRLATILLLSATARDKERPHNLMLRPATTSEQNDPQIVTHAVRNTS